jgi:AT-rich interactive domain-containing protein 1
MKFKNSSSIKTVYLVGGKQVDLFRLYLVVKERGGVLLVTIRRLWPEIALTLDIDSDNILYKTFLLRRLYTNCLLLWECYFDRGGLDPQLILDQVKLIPFLHLYFENY